jgi:hypothetical protein
MMNNITDHHHAYGILRNTTLFHIGNYLRGPTPIWNIQPFQRSFIDKIEEVADEHAFIDPENKKKEMWRRVLNGKGSFFVTDCYLDDRVIARVYYISEQKMESAIKEVDWELWGRIFQVFGKPRSSRWEATIFAMDRPRLFPEEGQLIGPIHINGGAARSCEPNSIIIIRKEEATRVLIHELLHAACTDDMTRKTDDIEGWTEAWAEWFLCAIIAKNNIKFDSLWRKQVAWALAQADECYKRGHIRSINDYGARYIVRRINVWKQLGIIPKYIPRIPEVKSLRFTIIEKSV